MWITLKTTSSLWEAELMQKILEANEIDSRVIGLGVESYFGTGTPAALQVRSIDQWTALLLLSPREEQLIDEDSES
jgi:hypothetical protein